MQRTDLLLASHAPFIHCGTSLKERYWNIILACLPALIYGIVFYGVPALAVVCLSTGSAMVWEALFKKIRRQEPRIWDGSSALLGLLFAMMLPATTPWWLVLVGTFLCVVVGREAYGGVGCNPVNSVLFAFAIVFMSWRSVLDFTGALGNFEVSFFPVEPLNAIKYMGTSAESKYDILGLLLGKQLGGIGSVFNLGLILGGVYLAIRRFIKWEISVMFLISLFITAWIFHAVNPDKYASPVFHLFTGYTMLGAFFLLTEDTTSPVNFLPKLLYGAMAGVMTMLIRNIGAYVEGVVFAILLSNVFHPLIDKIRPKSFGKGV
jgi:electron transport complex protein RnfD